jgi:signal transduction histidine kinase
VASAVRRTALLRPAEAVGGAPRYGQRVRRIEVIGWGRIADVAITVGLLASGLAELTLGDEEHGPLWANAVLMMAIALPALWRRSHPAWAFVASMTAVLVLIVAYYPTGTDGPGESWFGFLIMTFSLALHGEGRARAAATLYGAVAFAAINAGQLVEGTGAFDVFTAWVFPVIAWLAGWALHYRQTAAEHHRVRADEAEARRAEDARMAVELERARIARELHDMISHSVSVMVMQAAVERRLLKDEHPGYARTLQEIEHAGRDALGELRTLLGVLRETNDGGSLAPQPGLADLPVLIERVREAGLPVDLRVEGRQVELSPALQLTAYRIVQEGLTNVLKHAGDARAEVVVSYEPTRVGLEVRDDGSSPNGAAPGTGLLGLRERAVLYGGELETFVPEGGGFVLRANLPIQAE